MKNDKEVLPHYLDVTGSRIKIYNAHIFHSGEYTCYGKTQQLHDFKAKSTVHVAGKTIFKYLINGVAITSQVHFLSK